MAHSSLESSFLRERERTVNRYMIAAIAGVACVGADAFADTWTGYNAIIRNFWEEKEEIGEEKNALQTHKPRRIFGREEEPPARSRC